jgi:hypothetical protein
MESKGGAENTGPMAFGISWTFGIFIPGAIGRPGKSLHGLWCNLSSSCWLKVEMRTRKAQLDHCQSPDHIDEEKRVDPRND